MRIRNLAKQYLYQLTENEKSKLKIMISHNVICGKDFSSKNKINLYQFNKELKSLIEGGDYV